MVIDAVILLMVISPSFSSVGRPGPVAFIGGGDLDSGVVRGTWFAALLAIGGLIVGACGQILPSTGVLPVDYPLHVDNGTTMALTIVVNGQPVAVAPAKEAKAVPVAALPSLPWTVEARSASGRVVLMLTVKPGSVVDIRNADGTGSLSAPGARADLSCGRLDMYPGDSPMMGPPPGPGAPGDCAP